MYDEHVESYSKKSLKPSRRSVTLIDKKLTVQCSIPAIDTCDEYGKSVISKTAQTMAVTTAVCRL